MQKIYSTEYIYPIAFLDNQEAVLYMHQFSPDNIKLFKWDQKTHHIEQLLWSIFNPAAVQLLPHNKGFSFIDNGRLRIKHFQKRSPKTIDFDAPLLNINSLEWLDEHTCYCSAQCTDNFAIFELDDTGTLKYLVADINKDYMYPQKKDNSLFFIERSGNRYGIMQTEYSGNSHTFFTLSLHDKPIAFLKMISPQEGFFVEHDNIIDSEEKTALFSYYQIIKKGMHWHTQFLFSFAIPTHLFLYHNDQRLFESIMPLLPRKIGDHLYFVSCLPIHDYVLEPHRYNLIAAHVEKIEIPYAYGHCFVPIAHGKMLYWGGTRFLT